MSQITGLCPFQLRKPIKYSYNGDFKEAPYLELSEPTGDHSKYMIKLTMIINNVILKVSEKQRERLGDQKQPTPIMEEFDAKSEEDFNKQAEEIQQFLMAGFSLEDTDGELTTKFLEEFKNAILIETNSICMIDGTVPLKPVHWGEMSYKDQLDLAMKYCAFFGIGYLGDMMEK